jgi:hypothetical protein
MLASEYLASLGIRGIRYADQGSRGEAKAVFDAGSWNVERNGEVKVRSGGVIYYGWPKLPKGLVAGDKVRIKVQFSIMLDSWVIKSISKVRTKTNNEGL